MKRIVLILLIAIPVALPSGATGPFPVHLHSYDNDGKLTNLFQITTDNVAFASASIEIIMTTDSVSSYVSAATLYLGNDAVPVWIPQGTVAEDEYVLTYDHDVGQIKLKAASGGASSLNDLSDVDLTNPTPATGQVLKIGADGIAYASDDLNSGGAAPTMVSTPPIHLTPIGSTGWNVVLQATPTPSNTPDWLDRVQGTSTSTPTPTSTLTPTTTLTSTPTLTSTNTPITIAANQINASTINAEVVNVTGELNVTGTFTYGTATPTPVIIRVNELAASTVVAEVIHATGNIDVDVHLNANQETVQNITVANKIDLSQGNDTAYIQADQSVPYNGVDMFADGTMRFGGDADLDNTGAMQIGVGELANFIAELTAAKERITIATEVSFSNEDIINLGSLTGIGTITMPTGAVARYFQIPWDFNGDGVPHNDAGLASIWFEDVVASTPRIGIEVGGATYYITDNGPHNAIELQGKPITTETPYNGTSLEYNSANGQWEMRGTNTPTPTATSTPFANNQRFFWLSDGTNSATADIELATGTFQIDPNIGAWTVSDTTDTITLAMYSPTPANTPTPYSFGDLSDVSVGGASVGNVPKLNAAGVWEASSDIEGAGGNAFGIISGSTENAVADVGGDTFSLQIDPDYGKWIIENATDAVTLVLYTATPGAAGGGDNAFVTISGATASANVDSSSDTLTFDFYDSSQGQWIGDDAADTMWLNLYTATPVTTNTPTPTPYANNQRFFWLSDGTNDAKADIELATGTFQVDPNIGAWTVSDTTDTITLALYSPTPIATNTPSPTPVTIRANEIRGSTGFFEVVDVTDFIELNETADIFGIDFLTSITNTAGIPSASNYIDLYDASQNFNMASLGNFYYHSLPSAGIKLQYVALDDTWTFNGHIYTDRTITTTNHIDAAIGTIDSATIPSVVGNMSISNHINATQGTIASATITSASVTDLSASNDIVATDQVRAGSFVFTQGSVPVNINNPGAGEDNYVLKYDNAGNTIQLEQDATSAGGGDNAFVTITGATSSANVDSSSDTLTFQMTEVKWGNWVADDATDTINLNLDIIADDIDDIDMTGITTGQVLKYNAAGILEASSDNSGGAPASINDIADVNTVGATRNQMLKFGDDSIWTATTAPPRSHTIVIAATDSKADTNYDYKSDGTNLHTLFYAACADLNNVGGGVIRFTEGTFQADAILSVTYSNIAIDGAGPGRTILRRGYTSGSNNGIISFGLTTGYVATNEVTNNSLSNMTIIGEKTVYVAATDLGVYLSRTRYCKLYNIEILRTKGNAIYGFHDGGGGAANDDAYTEVNSVTIRDGDAAGLYWLYADFCVFSNIIVSGCSTGFNLENTIEFCNVMNCITSGNSVNGFYCPGGTNVAFSNCISTGDTNYGFTFGGGNNSLSGCLIVSSGQGMFMTGYGHNITNTIFKDNTGSGLLSQDGATYDVQVTGNYFFNNVQHGLYIKPNDYNWVVEGNHFYQNNLDNIFIGSGADNVTITNNTIRDATQEGIDVDGVTNLRVLNNRFEANDLDEINLSGTTDAIIKGNVFEDTSGTYDGIDIAGANVTADIHENRFEGTFNKAVNMSVVPSTLPEMHMNVVDASGAVVASDLDIRAASFSFKFTDTVMNVTEITGRDGYSLTLNEAANELRLRPGGGGASVLNDLTDVSTGGQSANDILVSNGSTWSPTDEIRSTFGTITNASFTNLSASNDIVATDEVRGDDLRSNTATITNASFTNLSASNDIVATNEVRGAVAVITDVSSTNMSASNDIVATDQMRASEFVFSDTGNPMSVTTTGAGYDGYVITYKDAQGRLVLAPASGGASSLSELSDVDSGLSASVGQVLKYAGSGVFEASDDLDSGGTPAQITSSVTATITADSDTNDTGGVLMTVNGTNIFIGDEDRVRVQIQQVSGNEIEFFVGTTKVGSFGYDTSAGPYFGMYAEGGGFVWLRWSDGTPKSFWQYWSGAAWNDQS